MSAANGHKYYPWMSGIVALYAAGHLSEYLVLLEQLRPEVTPLRFRQMLCTIDLLLIGSGHLQCPALEPFLQMTSRPSWSAVHEFELLCKRLDISLNLVAERRRYRNYLKATGYWDLDADIRRSLNQYFAIFPDVRVVVFDHDAMQMAYSLSALAPHSLPFSHKSKMVKYLLHVVTIENCCMRERDTVDSEALRIHELEHWPAQCDHSAKLYAGLSEGQLTFRCIVCKAPLPSDDADEMDYVIDDVLSGDDDPASLYDPAGTADL